MPPPYSNCSDTSVVNWILLIYCICTFIPQVDALPIDQKVNSNLKSLLEPYLFEAGLDPDELSTTRKKIIIDGLIMYQVIDKRHLELDDFAEGILNKLYKHTVNFLFMLSTYCKLFVHAIIVALLLRIYSRLEDLLIDLIC